MARIERVREAVERPLSLDHFTERAAQGWRLVSLEWERDVPGETLEPPRRLAPVPFGLRVADDCLHLEENPEEMRILQAMVELIVQDYSLSRIAAELNRRQMRTREGREWNASAIFQMLTRVLEVAPQVHASFEWAERKKQLPRVAWNS